MDTAILTDQDRKELLEEVFQGGHIFLTKGYPFYSLFIDKVNHVNSEASISELVLALSSYLSAYAVPKNLSSQAILEILIFPFQETLASFRANTETSEYCYRAFIYTLTAWCFDHPTPLSSAKLLSSLAADKGGSWVASKGFQIQWQKINRNLSYQLDAICEQKGIKKRDLQSIYRALIKNNATTMCIDLLKYFERFQQPDIKVNWIANYNIRYPF